MIRRAALTLALIATAISPTALLVESEPAASVPSSDRCFEDEPCWDCFTMGNHVCGPTDDHGVWWPCWAIDYPCDEEG